ncbi:MAG: hypothetical protein U0271_17010 [Polyangiaceae bacterium]
MSPSLGSPVGRLFGLLVLTTAAACSDGHDASSARPPACSVTPPAESSETALAEPAPPPPPRTWTPSHAGCDAVTVYRDGVTAGSVCVEDAATEGVTVIDLSDSWTPRVFAPDEKTGDAPDYRGKYLELAQNPSADLALNGISPTMTVYASRLTDEKRVACDAKLDQAPIAAVDAVRMIAADEKGVATALKQMKKPEVMKAVQGELVCAGLLKQGSVSGVSSASTEYALEVFRKRHAIVGSGLDADTVHALALGGDELALRGVLRGLRERVADAAGLIEDGSASGTSVLIADRQVDLSPFAPTGTELANGAPDLVGEATDAAARALGWTSPSATRAFFTGLDKGALAKLRVAVVLPVAPAYHTAAMDLRVEIDRGDISYDPSGLAAARKRGEEPRRPSFVVYAKDGDREVALIRWATTIGGWKKERMEDGDIALKYKESDVGERVWQKIIAAPAWLPPDSTPETDLVRESKEGELSLKTDLIQPGFRNAYGLVMLIHDELIQEGAKTRWADHGIRTHGSVDYRSIKNGTSHGCHRLYNQLVLRLSGFLLEHRNTVRRGKMRAGYHRTLEYKEQTIEVDVPTRGYLYELDPPVPVRVLEGRVLGDRQKPISSVIRLEPKDGAAKEDATKKS